ncbi:hypothetical protein BDA99DRAFT_542957 [Phascolomyces articulosus]|uniref:Uncharacterized protein n=1 Tax=Phascolomyces articulosus TaxID=60185 RepID=A0AAD5P8C3_9FUNG|nr:hypothetical protein BDA99DRAFT_542957 [Phascolomyces articulosus]
MVKILAAACFILATASTLVSSAPCNCDLNTALGTFSDRYIGHCKSRNFHEAERVGGQMRNAVENACTGYFQNEATVHFQRAAFACVQAAENQDINACVSAGTTIDGMRATLDVSCSSTTPFG